MHHPTGRLIFCFPAYFQSPDENQRRIQSKAEAFADELHSRQISHPDSHKELIESYIRNETIPWKYNQIVGFIELIDTVGGIKAYYWWVDSKRLSSSMAKKRFIYCGKIFDVCRNPRQKTNEQIRSDIRNFVSQISSLRKKFKRRYFDTGALLSSMMYFDLRAFLDDGIEEVKD